MLNVIRFIAFFLIINAPVFAQDNIKIFLDCQNYQYNCFEDFLRTEVPFVEFVRDRRLANVHILPTYQQTATNGVKVRLMIFGRETFSNRSDTLTFIREMNNTDAEYRDKLLLNIKAGLVPFLAQINQLDKIVINSVKTAKDSLATLRKESEKKDPWNYWVFRTGLGGYGQGDNIYGVFFWGGNVSASRTTEKLKTDFSLSNNVTRDRYSYTTNGEDKTVINKQVDYNLSASVVRAINKKWSAGGFLSAQSSLFKNYKYQIVPSLGVEYDVFPYAKYNEKYILFRYTLGTQINQYNKITIYDKTQETVLEQQAGVYGTFVKKWGNLSSSVKWRNFMNDFQKNGVDFYLSASLRLAKGLNLSCGGTFSSIHNQINLEKGDVSEQDVLIKRRQLATSFDYFAGIGLSYTFGSIYNNVVNPRFNTIYNNISLNW